MSRHLGLFTGALIVLSSTHAAGAQATRRAGTDLPAPGTRLERVKEVPATSRTSLPVGGAGATDLSLDACAMRLRDPHTGHEFLIQRSDVRQNIARDTVGPATTRVETSLKGAVGEYRLIEAGADVKDSRRLTVDCISSRVVAPAKSR